jgi:hypothetical protein
VAGTAAAAAEEAKAPTSGQPAGATQQRHFHDSDHGPRQACQPSTDMKKAAAAAAAACAAVVEQTTIIFMRGTYYGACIILVSRILSISLFYTQNNGIMLMMMKTSNHSRLRARQCLCFMRSCSWEARTGILAY